jgi:coenzyme PQQ synthesis protein D (PqqD)
MLLMEQERFRPSRAVRASISGDGLILLDVDGGMVLSSNAVGARIWQLIARQHTTGEIARQLADDYVVPLDRALGDVQTFVADLLARGLVAGDPRR